MEDKIKEIVSFFLKTPVAQLSNTTLINRAALGSSILMHRMYAQIIEIGVDVKDYWQINNLGDLLNHVDGVSKANTTSSDQHSYDMESAEAPSLGIGIDLEEISNLPTASDFRIDLFYKENFSIEEISYCSLQPNPYSSFTGLFAAKEAIVKADNSFRGKPFNTIHIKHTMNGKPRHEKFHLSISHTSSHAVALAVSIQSSVIQREMTNEARAIITENKIPHPFGISIAILALLLSITAIVLIVYKEYN